MERMEAVDEKKRSKRVGRYRGKWMRTAYYYPIFPLVDNYVQRKIAGINARKWLF